MGHAQVLLLLTDKDDLTNEAGKSWVGGRSALIVTASAYPTTLDLQLEHRDGTWITINSSTINADGVYNYDLPAGNYRMALTGGTATDVYATLSRIVY